MRRVSAVVASLMILILMLMVGFSIRAASERSIMDNAHLMSDVWFQVTLLDAYAGFLIFYILVWLNETSLVPRLLWFMAIMILGNMATAVYVLWQLKRFSKNPESANIYNRLCQNSNSAPTAVTNS